jgi:penicillin-binding protein 2
MPRHRVLFIALVFLLPFLAVEARLVYLQGFLADYHRERILRRRTGIRLLPLWRGRILDRNGTVLAHDQRGFDVQIRIGDFDKKPETFERLVRLLPDRREEIEERLKKLRGRIEEKVIGLPLRRARRVRYQEGRLAYPFLVDIPFQAALMIESHPDLLPGLDVQEKLRRRYPQGSTACHVVGYVGLIRKEEYDRNLKNGAFRAELGESVEDAQFELLRIRGLFMDEVIGRKGIERHFHKELRGRRGAILRERDTKTGETRNVAAALGEPGRDIRLTLDIEAQRVAEKALEGKRGAIVAMDVNTGEVYVLASAPGFDPNDFAPPPNNKAVVGVYKNPYKPALNRAVASAQPPGSVFKLLTGSAALQEGKINAGTTFNCEESIILGGHSFDCWIFDRGRGHGPQDLPGGLQRSCNIFFYNCGKRLRDPKLGILAFRNWMAAFGLGSKTGIELSGESAGRIPTEAEAKRATLGTALNLSIGQGSLLLTPLQAARLTAAVANGGHLLRPRLVLRKGEGPEFKETGVRKEHLALVRQGMWQVVNEPGGTASLCGMDKFDAGGKTGTAQTVRGKPNHAWFACFFPRKQPRFAILVFVEYGDKGSKAAAPLAAPVAESLARYLPPPGGSGRAAPGGAGSPPDAERDSGND